MTENAGTTPASLWFTENRTALSLLASRVMGILNAYGETKEEDADGLAGTRLETEIIKTLQESGDIGRVLISMPVTASAVTDVGGEDGGDVTAQAAPTWRVMMEAIMEDSLDLSFLLDKLAQGTPAFVGDAAQADYLRGESVRLRYYTDLQMSVGRGDPRALLEMVNTLPRNADVTETLGIPVDRGDAAPRRMPWMAAILETTPLEVPTLKAMMGLLERGADPCFAACVDAAGKWTPATFMKFMTGAVLRMGEGRLIGDLGASADGETSAIEKLLQHDALLSSLLDVLPDDHTRARLFLEGARHLHTGASARLDAIGMAFLGAFAKTDAGQAAIAHMDALYQDEGGAWHALVDGRNLLLEDDGGKLRQTLEASREWVPFGASHLLRGARIAVIDTHAARVIMDDRSATSFRIEKPVVLPEAPDHGFMGGIVAALDGTASAHEKQVRAIRAEAEEFSRCQCTDLLERLRYNPEFRRVNSGCTVNENAVIAVARKVYNEQRYSELNIKGKWVRTEGFRFSTDTNEWDVIFTKLGWINARGTYVSPNAITAVSLEEQSKVMGDDTSLRITADGCAMTLKAKWKVAAEPVTAICSGKMRWVDYEEGKILTAAMPSQVVSIRIGGKNGDIGAIHIDGLPKEQWLRNIGPKTQSAWKSLSEEWLKLTPTIRINPAQARAIRIDVDEKTLFTVGDNTTEKRSGEERMDKLERADFEKMGDAVLADGRFFRIEDTNTFLDAVEVRLVTTKDDASVFDLGNEEPQAILTDGSRARAASEAGVRMQAALLAPYGSGVPDACIARIFKDAGQREKFAALSGNEGLRRIGSSLRARAAAAQVRLVAS